MHDPMHLHNWLLTAVVCYNLGCVHVCGEIAFGGISQALHEYIQLPKNAFCVFLLSLLLII